MVDAGGWTLNARRLTLSAHKSLMLFEFIKQEASILVHSVQRQASSVQRSAPSVQRPAPSVYPSPFINPLQLRDRHWH